MNRGEVWRMALDRAAGSATGDDTPDDEMPNRTVVIVSNDALAILPLRVVVPLTLWKDDFTSAPWMVRVPPVLNSGLEQPMAADALQVRSISTARLTHKLGDLPDRVADEIAAAVAGIIRR